MFGTCISKFVKVMPPARLTGVVAVPRDMPTVVKPDFDAHRRPEIAELRGPPRGLMMDTAVLQGVEAGLGQSPPALISAAFTADFY